jgi:hypothetical protein
MRAIINPQQIITRPNQIKQGARMWIRVSLCIVFASQIYVLIPFGFI